MDRSNRRATRRAEKYLHRYNISARQDFRWWLMLLVGAAFIYAGATLDPLSNCNESGECAPWLVPIAFVIGMIAVVLALAHLKANLHHGSRVDFEARRLYWWERHELDDARSLALDDVARIKTTTLAEIDRIYFYDHANNLMPCPEHDVFPSPIAKWAGALVAHFPHIMLEDDT